MDAMVISFLEEEHYKYYGAGETNDDNKDNGEDKIEYHEHEIKNDAEDDNEHKQKNAKFQRVQYAQLYTKNLNKRKRGNGVIREWRKIPKKIKKKIPIEAENYILKLRNCIKDQQAFLGKYNNHENRIKLLEKKSMAPIAITTIPFSQVISIEDKKKLIRTAKEKLLITSQDIIYNKNSLIKVKKNLDKKAEKIWQEQDVMPFLGEIQKLLQKEYSIDIEFHDLNKKHLMGYSLVPGIAISNKKFSLPIASTLHGIIELKTIINENELLGQLLIYSRDLLVLQPHRKSVTVMGTNMELCYLIRTTYDVDNNLIVELQKNILFEDAILGYIKLIMHENSAEQFPNYAILKVIGLGGTSIVYEGIPIRDGMIRNDEHVVIKCLLKSRCDASGHILSETITRENLYLSFLCKYFKGLSYEKLSPTALMYSPVGSPLTSWESMKYPDIIQDFIRACYFVEYMEKDCIFTDLRWSNFIKVLIKNKEYILFRDGGDVYFKNEPDPSCGTISYSPQTILKHFCDNKICNFRSEYHVEVMGKILSCILYTPLRLEVKRISNFHINQKYVDKLQWSKEIYQCWEKYGQILIIKQCVECMHWEQLYKIAKSWIFNKEYPLNNLHKLKFAPRSLKKKTK